MINLLDVSSLSGYETMKLPGGGAGSGTPGTSASSPEHASDYGGCAAWRPGPDVRGNLQVDPEINIPSPGIDLNVAYFYNSNSPYNGPFGYARTVSTNLTAQAYGTPTVVDLQRGDGSVAQYKDNGSGTFIPQSNLLLNSLVKDTGNGLWKETTLDGMVMAYPLDTTGQITSISYVQDPVGNRHTYSYASGLLESVEDMVGRYITFLYNSGLLETIQDPAQRRTTFAYDQSSVAGKPLLTTVTGPTGCVTEYGYDGTGLLTRITNPNGYDTTYLYDSMNRVLQKTVAGAGTDVYSYPAGQMIAAQSGSAPQTAELASNFSVNQQANGAGAVTSYTYNSRGQRTSEQNMLGAIVTTSYDSLGNVTGVIDALGHATTIQRDVYNNPTTLIYADGAITSQIWGYGGSSFDTTGAKRRLQVSVDALGNRTSYSYNSRGQMVSVEDATGIRTTYGYDSYGNRNSVQNAYDNITTTVYDIVGNATRITDPLNHTTEISYDPQNRPLEIKDALNAVTTLAYDSAGNLSVRIDALGNATQYSYNAFNKPTEIQDALGNVTTVVYDAQGRAIALVNPLGNRTSTVYDVLGRPEVSINALNAYTTMQYDILSRATTFIDALGYATRTVYDIANRPVQTINALAYTTETVYDAVNRVIANVDALGYRSSTVYNKAGWPIASIDALNHYSTTVYDKAGRPVEYKDALGYVTTTLYDRAGRAETTVDALGYATTTVYDAASRPVESWDELGYRTTTVYDAVSRPIATIDALGRFSSTTYDKVGRPTESIDALGYITTSIYDAVGRLKESKDALSFVSTMLYDKAGRMTETINALGYRTTYGYDAVGQQISTKDALGAISTNVYDPRGLLKLRVMVQGQPTTYSYDALGQAIQIWRPQYANQSLVTSYVYDAVGRRVASELAMGYRTTTVYDALGQVTARVDALDHRTSYLYDAVGNQVGERNALEFRTTLTYDALGRQTSVRDAVNNITNNLYDARGLLRSVQQPWGAFTTNTYDAVGNVIERVDGRNYATTLSYDVLDRIIFSQAMDGSLTTHSYDAVGREKSAWNESGVSTTTYDAISQVIRVDSATAVTGSLVPYSLSYGYDSVGNRLLMRDGEGNRTTYVYTRDNLLCTDITGPYEPQRTRNRFDFDGSLYQRQKANNQVVTETRPNNVNGWPAYIDFKQPDGTIHEKLSVANAVGNRTRLQELNSGGPSTFTYFEYDSVNQLLSERRVDTPGYANTYTYDGTGNRLTQHSLGVRTTYQYGSGNRLESEQTGTAFTTCSYDQNGNLTLINAANALTTQLWNTDNRLIRVENPDGSVEQMSYGSDGLRRKKSVTPAGGSTSDTIFVYDGQNLLQERNGSGLILANYTWGPDGRNMFAGQAWEAGVVGNVALLQRRASTPGDLAGGTSRYLGPDFSSNNWLLFDSTGAVTDRMTYEAFGELFSRSGSTAIPFLFGGAVGYYTDALRRLNVGWRVYDPAAGRWTSLDPIGFDGGLWNLYGYVGNDPVNEADPRGLARWVTTNPWRELRPYRHAHLEFNFEACSIDGCETKGVGFWPADIWGDVFPKRGIIHLMEPYANSNAPVERYIHRENFDRSFEVYLCDCIREAFHGKPPVYYLPANPHSAGGLLLTPFAYNCGSWANDMWECASEKRRLLGPVPRSSSSGGSWTSPADNAAACVNAMKQRQG